MVNEDDTLACILPVQDGVSPLLAFVGDVQRRTGDVVNLLMGSRMNLESDVKSAGSPLPNSVPPGNLRALCSGS